VEFAVGLGILVEKFDGKVTVHGGHDNTGNLEHFKIFYSKF
jgi:hypothetical protein